MISGLVCVFRNRALAFKQATYNDEIREVFRNLLLEEMEVFDDFVKLGKVKGWLNLVRTYVP
ncbi:MAG TPA: hypothetical protein DDW87_12135 [Firmicutes bacterium]|nr:hypothetical protein [Bacillota bacterium]